MSACATGGEACREDAITGMQRCQPASGNYAEAAGTAVAAGAAWGAVGCTVNGCELPLRCNSESKQCERIRCGEGGDPCPPGFNCDAEQLVCK
jgi:hypothetical protein